MRSRFAKFSVELFAAVLIMLGLTACSQSQVTETLDLVIAAADAAVSVLAPGTAALITPYLSEVSAAVDFATTELASDDSAAIKAAKIAQQFATIAAPNLPPGTAQVIVQAVAAVGKAVITFLGSLQATGADLQSTPVGANAFFAGGAKSLKVSKNKLAQIAVHNAKLRAKLAAAKSK